MQGNSKYLRWSPLFTCCCVFVILSSTVIAVPVRPRRMVRETFSFDSINSNTISNATCFHDGLEVQKSTVKCEIKTGCRLIQKTGECCPEYQCDCNLDDRPYENGEKIVSHNPCRRCVCKGGEITCNDVSCYIRDDCKPKYLKGVCCPQYDNCPPIDDVKIPAAKEAVETKTSKNDVIISMTTTPTGNAAQNSDINSMQLANENPLGIKIKEITKPEEIRITDDKPKPYNPFKSTTTTTTTTTTIASTTATDSPNSEDVTKLTRDETSTSYSTSTITSMSTENPKDSVTEDTNQSSGEHESRDYMDDGVPNEASIAPPIKASADGEVEAPLLLFSADSNSIGDDTGNKSVRQTTENSTSAEFDASSELNFDAFSSTTETESESSTSSDVLATSTENSGEETDLAAATPKNVVVVRQGGKTESFHISGTDGLQRVEELDVLNSTTESSHEDGELGRSSSEFASEVAPTANSIESVDRKSSKELSTESSSTPSSIEVFDATIIDSVEITKKLDSTLNFNESSTENLTNNSIEVSTPVTTENSSEISSESLLFGEQVYGTIFYSPDEKTTASSSSEEPFETVYFGPTEDGSSTTEGFESSSSFESNSSSESSVTSTTLAPVSATEPSSTPKGTSTEAFVESTSRFSYEDEEVTPAENPEYPYIPDDLSLHNKDVEEEEKRRLPSKVLEESFSSTVGPPIDEIKEEFRGEESSTQGPSLEVMKESHKMDIVESRAPGEPQLIPEWERTTTTTSTDSTPAKVINEESTTLGPKETSTTANEINKTAFFEAAVMGTKTNKSEALTNIETLPNYVDSEEKFGRKEPTTERPTTKDYSNVDDSDEGSASSAQFEFDSSIGYGESPKDDAESIKLDSSGGEDTNMKKYSFFESLAVPRSFMNHWDFVNKQNQWKNSFSN